MPVWLKRKIQVLTDPQEKKQRNYFSKHDGTDIPNNMRREGCGQLGRRFPKDVTVPLPAELERMQDRRGLLPQVPQVDAVIG